MRHLFNYTLVFAVLAAISTTALGQEESKGKENLPEKIFPKIEEIFAKLDTNDDGLLSLEEFKVGTEKLHAKFMEKKPFAPSAMNKCPCPMGACECPKGKCPCPACHDFKKGKKEPMQMKAPGRKGEQLHGFKAGKPGEPGFGGERMGGGRMMGMASYPGARQPIVIIVTDPAMLKGIIDGKPFPPHMAPGMMTPGVFGTKGPHALEGMGGGPAHEAYLKEKPEFGHHRNFNGPKEREGQIGINQ